MAKQSEINEYKTGMVVMMFERLYLYFRGPCSLIQHNKTIRENLELCSNHFSHPFLGTYEVVQFLDLGYLKGTHSWGWYTAPYPFHGILGWKPHTISFSFQYHVTSYHAIGIIEASHIPSKPYHHSKAVTGCLGSFFCKYEIISAGCNTGPLDSIFCGQVLEDFPDVLSYK